MSGPSSPGSRRRLLVLAAFAVASAVVAAVVVLLVVRSGPGEEDARDLVEDYLAARTADGCTHLRFHSERLAEYDPSREECLEVEGLEEGEYLEYELTEVSVDGDRAQVDVEDRSDAPSGPFTVHLVVEDGEWHVNEIERHE